MKAGRHFGIGVLVLFFCACASAGEKQARIVVTHPTIIAFFGHDPSLTEDDANEVLSDFQLYAQRAHDPLTQRGIELRVVDASEFNVVVGKTVTAFKAAKVQVGYYLIAPGRKPRVEYGVTTDTDLLQLADEYFGANRK